MDASHWLGAGMAVFALIGLVYCLYEIWINR
jgi:hypothetical protein